MKSPADLRKAAILITALDSASGDALLDQMPPALAQRVRDTIMDLEDISTEEQQKVLAEFLGRNAPAKKPASTPSRKPTTTSIDDVELEISPQAEARTQALAKAPPAAVAAPTVSAQPFDFLRKIAGRHIAQVLEHESPQAIAAVISALEPQHAAEVLETLPTSQSIEALARMANLGDMSPEVLHDLAEGLKEQLAPQLQAQNIRKESLAGIQRVLSALDGDRRKALLASLGRQNSPLVQQLGYLAPEELSQPVESKLEESVSPATTYVARETFTAAREVSPTATSFDSVNEADLPELAELFSLPLPEIKHIFLEVTPDVAILALIGTEPRLLERFLQRLPAALAKDLGRRLANPGPVRLRDLDRARLQVRRSLHELFESDEEEVDSSVTYSS